MRRICLLAAAAVLLTAPGALAQDDNTNVQDVTVTGSRIVRQDFEAISPVTTVGSEQIQFTSHTSDQALGWRERSERTSSRVYGQASSVRVIRACEINLALGDENCAAN